VPKVKLKDRQRRPKGEGSIYQLSNGKFRTQLDLGVDIHGKRIRKTVTADSKTEIINKLNNLKAERIQGNIQMQPDITFSDYADRWLSMKMPPVLKETTYSSYLRNVEVVFKPFFGDIKMKDITAPIVNNLLHSLIDKGLKMSSVKITRLILVNILKQAEDEGVIVKSPIRGTIRLPKDTDSALGEKHLDEKEVSILINQLRAIKTGKTVKGKLYYIVSLALASGARRGELLALKWDNIDMVKNTVTFESNYTMAGATAILVKPKTKSGVRKVVVAKKILRELQDLNTGESPYVFTANNQLIHPLTLGNTFRTVLRDLNITQIAFHGLRHTHATLLIAKGVNMKTVSVRMGHTDIQTTLNLYAHAMPQQDAEAADLIGNIL
jgi:Site-specific recombinase XerD